MRYSAPEKYCEYGVYQVGLCLSHPPRGGGGEGWAASQSKVESCTTFRTTPNSRTFLRHRSIQVDWALKSKPKTTIYSKRKQREGEKSSNKTDGAEFAKKCVNSTTGSNNQRLFTTEVFLTLSQISSYVSRISTKRKQLSASEYSAAENESIPRGKNDIMRSSEESHSHPFENEEFHQLCEMKRKKSRIVIAKNDNAESRLQKV